jgi:hypothetical protein
LCFSTFFVSAGYQSPPPLPGVAAGTSTANHVPGSHPGSAIAEESHQHTTGVKGSRCFFVSTFILVGFFLHDLYLFIQLVFFFLTANQSGGFAYPVTRQKVKSNKMDVDSIDFKISPQLGAVLTVREITFLITLYLVCGNGVAALSLSLFIPGS